MADSPSETKAPPARPLNRWGIGSLSILQTLLLAAALVALNYLAYHHYHRADLSRSEDYSLSPATRKFLGSPALADRPQPVKWILAFRRSSPFYERVRALAEEYQRLSRGRIELEIVDPLRSPDRTQEVAAAYGLTLVRDLLIIDARLDAGPAVREDANQVKTLNPHIKLALAEDMAVHGTDGGKRTIRGFQGEDVLTARLVEAIEGRPKKMALIADKSRFGRGKDSPSRKALEEKLRFQNIELVEIQAAGLADVPEELAGLVIAAPAFDFTDAEMALLERYWARPRAALLVLCEPAGVPSRLRAFLRAHGVSPRQDRVISRPARDRLVTTAAGVFTSGIEFIEDLAGQTTELGGATASIEVREGAEDLLNRKIYPMGLIQVAPGFWGESKFGQGNETFDEVEDKPAPFHLAACVIRGAEADDRFAADTARMVVISNTDFLDPSHQRAENLDFLASSTNWLVGREELAGIGPRPLRTYKLPLLEAQVSFINRVNLFFLPAFLLLVGAFVWSSRRA